MIYALLLACIGIIAVVAKYSGQKKQEAIQNEADRITAEKKAQNIYRAKRLHDSVDLMSDSDLERLRIELNSVK